MLELKMITLFFNKHIEQFKKYTSIQYKLKMNKSFESMLELIDLINSDNILISELSQFQYALIELQKGTINNTQKIISDMNTNTVYHEIALVLNAEIEDYINQNYKVKKKQVSSADGIQRLKEMTIGRSRQGRQSRPLRTLKASRAAIKG